MLLDHTLGIFTHPDSEWKVIRGQRRSKTAEFLTHVPIIALIPAIAFYYGVTQVGWSLGGSEPVFLTAKSAAILCAMSYIAALIGVWIFGEFINWMTVTYSEEKIDPHHGMAMAVYVTVPIFLAGIAGALPILWLNAAVTALAGAYSIYLIYEGIPILMNIEKERGFLYSTSIVTVALVLLVTMRVGTVLFWIMLFGPEYQTAY
jgi:prepilin signal peptidase PulO-like enzyme (type II secretory pathway)